MHLSWWDPCPCSSVGIRRGQTDTQTAMTTIHFVSATPYAKCKYQDNPLPEERLKIFEPNLVGGRRAPFYTILHAPPLLPVKSNTVVAAILNFFVDTSNVSGIRVYTISSQSMLSNAKSLGGVSLGDLVDTAPHLGSQILQKSTFWRCK